MVSFLEQSLRQSNIAVIPNPVLLNPTSCPVTEDEVKRMILLIFKNKKEGRRKFCVSIVQGKLYLCICMKTLFCKFLSFHENFDSISKSNMVCFFFSLSQGLYFSCVLPHSLAWSVRTCLMWGQGQTIRKGGDKDHSQSSSEQLRDISTRIRSQHLIHFISLGHRCLI